MRTRAARSNAAFVAHPAGAGYLDRGPARNLGSPLETLVVRDGYEDAGDCFDSSLPYGRTGRCLAVFYRRRRRRCLQLHIRLSRQGRDSLGLCGRATARPNSRIRTLSLQRKPGAVPLVPVSAAE
jgi:hypothetical protein